MKKFIFLGMLSPIALFAQVLNHQTALSSKAERHLQFKVTDAPNDVLEIGNSTSLNGQFQPTIWAHKESSNVTPLALTSHIISSVDNGTNPLINLNAAIGIFDNNAPNTSQFPWGNGSSVSPIENRPILGIHNASTRLLTVAANGNIGINTTSPSAKLHNVGSVKFENLSFVTSKCPLYIDVNTYEVGKLSNFNCMPASQSKNYIKNDISNPLNIINNIKTAELNDGNNNKYAVIESSEYQNMDSENIIPYLIESIKELSAKVEELEAKLLIQKSEGKGQISDLNIKMYPNPVKNIVNFELKEYKDALFSIEIYDRSGKMLSMLKEFSNNGKLTLGISNIPTGIYYYRLLSDSGTEIKTGKFQKQ